MKYLIFIIISLMTFTLSSCDLFKESTYEYEDYTDQVLTSHSEAENISNNRYIVYYYETSSEPCKEVKQDILSFFDEFDLIDFYILDTGLASDISNILEVNDEPSIIIFSDNQVLESYIGLTQVKSFINKYENIELDYDYFSEQHVTNYQDVLDVNNDVYILYYYLENCPYCMAVKGDFLKFAISKSVGDIFFMNGALVNDPDNIPTELTILNSGTPILVIMSNGEFANEYYSGKDAVLEYISRIGKSDITTDYVSD